ncbi:MAG TPA: helix-turn-helix domain-containing protein [Nitrososphaeraceae archaeon]
MNNAYKHEPNANNVRERILLIRRIMSDGQDIIRMVSKELHRSIIAWAYKWLRRFDNEGLEGLENKPRSGRPPDVPQEKLSKIRSELSENPSGWKAKEIIDII